MNGKMLSWMRTAGLVALGLAAGLILSARLGCSPETRAQTTGTYGTYEPDTGVYSNPFSRVVTELGPSVVKILVEKEVSGVPGVPFGKFFGPFEFEFRFPDNPMPAEGLGSGFIYEKVKDGYLVMTNNHVVGGATKIVVQLYDGTEIKDKDVEVGHRHSGPQDQDDQGAEACQAGQLRRHACR